MNDIIEYILTWLCYGNADAAQRVAYSADPQALETHDVLIVPCGHLGKDIVLPDMVQPVIEQPQKGKFIIRTDIVYTAFFFISRAEELINPQRDRHRRFLAQYSILGQSNRLQTPLLDMYAHALLTCLGEPTPTAEFNRIYLTHDIDSIAQYRHLRGAIGGLLRGQWKQVLHSLDDIRQDPLYTFPWMIKQDATIQNEQWAMSNGQSPVSVLYFVKRTHGHGYDYPQYNLHGHDYLQLKNILRVSGARLGVHGSYYGKLPKANGQQLIHRSHYLRCSIKQMQRLVNAGYTDDFTMGFAYQAGFRLQTTRAVQWINPQTMTLTSLTLHPLTVMDNTLNQANYMHLTEDEAFALCRQLIAQVRTYHGDLCLLWHNSSFASSTYHTSLYPKILQLLNGK